MHIIFGSLLILFIKNYQIYDVVHACRNYSLPKLARFLRYSVVTTKKSGCVCLSNLSESDSCQPTRCMVGTNFVRGVACVRV